MTKRHKAIALSIFAITSFTTVGAVELPPPDDYRYDMSYEGEKAYPFYKEPSLLERVLRPIEADSVHWKLYLPITAMPIEKYYSKSQLSRLNKNNTGLGLGRAHRYSAHEHEWYVMGLNDSNSKLQVNVGYNYSYHFHQKQNWSLAVGVTAGLTSIAGVHGRAPFPYILPTAKLSVGCFELSALYIPDTTNDIKPSVFIWGAYKF